MENKKHEYSNGEITVVWKPNLCIHSAKCVAALPQVYNPNKKPWIQVGNASTQALKDQVSTCPSGALSYYMNDIKNKGMEEKEILETKIEVIKNGPLMVFGTLLVTNSEGQTETKNKRTTFCRCGASSNKPYCDGSHKKIEWKDD
jgi:uncharacterized Fe-S cluster protein YjdI